MVLSQIALAELYKNQMNHFDTLRDSGIDVGMTSEDVVDMITTAYEDNIQTEIFTFLSLGCPSRAIPYLISTELPKENPETKEVSTIELQLKTYETETKRIPLFSSVSLRMFEQFRELAKIEKKSLGIIIGIALRNILNKKAIQFLKENISFNNWQSLLFDANPEMSNSEDIDIIENVISELPRDSRKILQNVLDSVKPSYLHTAQEFTSMINKCGDRMYEKTYRGGVSRIVCGTGVSNYVRLNAAFSILKGSNNMYGGFRQIGKFADIPIWESVDLLPEEALCVWKNDNNIYDISVLFSTHTPLLYNNETGTFDCFGDYKVIEPRYVTRIEIVNLR